MRIGCLPLIALALSPANAVAGEVTRYVYDAKGRLVVLDSRRPGGGAFNTYLFDRADNRARATLSGPFRSVTLPPDAKLALGQVVMSDDRRFLLIFQWDGNLVLYDQSGSPLWASGTNGSGAVQAAMQSDGNLVIYNASALPLWYSGTNGNAGARLDVQVDGNVVIYSAGGVPLWATNTCCR